VAWGKKTIKKKKSAFIAFFLRRAVTIIIVIDALRCSKIERNLKEPARISLKNE